MVDKSNKHSESNKEEEELKGVHGWLWWFAFSLSFLTPLFILGSIFSDTTNVPVIVFNLIMIALAITVGVAIFTEKDKAIIWAKELWTAYLLIAIFDLILYFVFPMDLPESFLSNPFRNVIVSVIWLLYLNNSERVKNTFKNRAVNWKRMSAVILIAVGVYVAIMLISAYSPSTQSQSSQNSFNYQTPTILTVPQKSVVDGELNPNYGVFHEFKDQTKLNEAKFAFSSDYPIRVYYVPSEADYQAFMKGDKYDTYQGCSFEDQTSGEIDCNVTTGGVILYNPSSYLNTTYKITY